MDSLRTRARNDHESAPMRRSRIHCKNLDKFVSERALRDLKIRSSPAKKGQRRIERPSIPFNVVDITISDWCRQGSACIITFENLPANNVSAPTSVVNIRKILIFVVVNIVTTFASPSVVREKESSAYMNAVLTKRCWSIWRAQECQRHRWLVVGEKERVVMTSLWQNKLSHMTYTFLLVVLIYP